MFTIKFKSICYNAILVHAFTTSPGYSKIPYLKNLNKKKKKHAFECTYCKNRRMSCTRSPVLEQRNETFHTECKNETTSQPDERRPVLFVADRSCYCSHSADNPHVRHSRTFRYCLGRGEHTVRRRPCLSHTNDSNDLN